MCGILGQFSKDTPIDKENFIHALKMLTHRGPDSISFCFWDQLNALSGREPASLPYHGVGHTRLSIVDLSEKASQPMLSQDKRYILSFNGEIYNYVELRNELKSLGVKFLSDSDTEVLLYALIVWGEQALKKINGMWAFIFYDFQKKRLIFSRDNFGKKPLFYYQEKNCLYISSEIKSIYQLTKKKVRELDADYLLAFLVSGNWPVSADNETLYKKIFSVSPGSYMVYELEDGCLKKEHYKTDDHITPVKERLERDLMSAVSLRLQADVPVGIFISGGVDSTAIASYANSLLNKEAITYFTADTSFGNDLHYAQQVAKCLGVNLKKIFIPHDHSIIASIEKITRQYELPTPLLGNSIAMNHLYEGAAKEGVKVVLDGTGGDEIFGGYYDYYHRYLMNSFLKEKKFILLFRHLYHLAKKGRLSPKLLGRETLLGLLSSLVSIPEQVWKKNLPFNYLTTKKNYSLHKFQKNTSLLDFQLYDIKSGRLPMWLYMNDMNSMMHSIEARSPFLDINLFKYVFLEAHDKFQNGYNKYFLRSILPKNISNEIRWRQDKQGLRWGVTSAFLNCHLDDIKRRVCHSEILRGFLDVNQFLKHYSRKKSDYLDGILLRMFALTIFEEQFSCRVYKEI